MNRVRGGRYRYPRYFFTNRSVDIRGIFVETCSRLGVTCRCSGSTVSVAQRHDVAKLDAFVGPKS
jgi:hypothetical protein